ncbi:hydrogenase [Aquiflexum sp.]|uniref:hydrogenase n=1 Tax=Aquiflexum sp. TaxID=1872584 RepID=UPI0035940128
MENTGRKKWQSDWLLFLGILLFLLGLLIGLCIPLMMNPRMGLTAHLEGVMNGMFLVILGLTWNRLILNDRWLSYTFWLILYGSFANFLAVTIASITGAGKMMPIAGGKEGTPVVEGLISFLLISLALAMIFVCVVVLNGLYRNMKSRILSESRK